MERRELDGLTREELIARAEGLGVPRPRVLTKAELVDEILARTAQGEPERARLRGFLGRARDLLSRVVERGLHMPETARALRGEAPPEPEPEPWPPPPPRPRATTTLAEIYASQGHTDRAIAVLDELLAREPEHEEARRLRERLIEKAQRAQGEGAEARGAGAEEEEYAEEEYAEEEDAGADTEAAEAKAEDAGADTEDAKDAGVEAAGAPATGDAGSIEPIEPPIAGEQDLQPEPVSVASEPAPAPPPRDPSPAEAPAPSAIAEGVAAGAALGLAAALQDERAELPARYNVDEIVGLAVDPETLYVYWEVRPRTLARARARRAEGQLVIRVVAVLPSWERPVVAQRDLAIDALFGDMFVRDIPAGAHLRMCTGWLDGDVFEPFAVGLEVAAPRPLPVAPRPPPPEPEASAQAALQDEIPADGPAAPTSDAQPRLEGAAGDALSPASGTLDVAGASLPASGASGQAGGPAAATQAASADPLTAPPPAPSAPAARSRADTGAAAAAPAGGSDVATQAAAPAAGRDTAAEAAVPAASRDVAPAAPAPVSSSETAPGAVTPGPSAAIPAAPALVSSSEGPARFPSGTAPTSEALAQAVAATRDLSSEGPPRFPSGRVPTPEALAQAVAATRGGSSDLVRGGGGRGAWPGSSGQPHASEALRRAGAGQARSPGGGSELRTGAERARSLGGGTQLWRSFSTRARPPSGNR